MKSVKNFLIAFVAIYVVIGIGINVLYGPPGFSHAFLEQNGAETDQYLEIVKEDAYKLWAENPEENPPDDSLQKQITFVDQFRDNPEFRAEMQRRDRYDAITDWFNVIMLTVLVVVLGRGPVTSFIQGMVAAERERIENIERKRSEVARRKSKAEHKIERLADEREKAEKRAAERIAEETTRIETSTDDALKQIVQEMDDRRRHEELLGRQRLASMLADEAVAILEERHRNEASTAQSDAEIGQFLEELGGRS